MFQEWPRRRRRLIGWAVAATVMALIVVVIVHSPTTPLTCPAPRGSGSAATASQAGDWQLAMYRGHEASTAENGTAKLPVVYLVRSTRAVRKKRSWLFGAGTVRQPG